MKLLGRITNENNFTDVNENLISNVKEKLLIKEYSIVKYFIIEFLLKIYKFKNFENNKDILENYFNELSKYIENFD